jgi:selenocysteine lyase/cysteine desulfurase
VTIYLDNASTSHPKPEEVYRDADGALRELAAHPEHPSHQLGDLAAALLQETREEAAALLGLSDSRRVIFALSGTDALNMALKGLLQDGDHVVSTTMEREAVSRPLTHMQMGGHIALTRVEVGADGRIDPDLLARAIRHRTRLVVLSHGCSALGTVQPAEEIARRVRQAGATLLLDATHTAGIVPIDMQGWDVDLVATSGHRGLYGPAGTGLLLVGESIRLTPFREGESGGAPDLKTQPLEMPWALEAGMPNLPGLAGLRAGMQFVRRLTVETIREHQTTLIKRFIGAIGLDDRFCLYAARGDVPRTGTVSFTLRGLPPGQIARVMDRTHGIRVGAGLQSCPGVHRALSTFPGGTVRVSLGWFNTEEEIDRAVVALRQIADAGVSEALQPAGA